MRERNYTGFRLDGAIVVLALLCVWLIPLTGCKDEGTPNAPPVPKGATPQPLSLDSLLRSISGEGSPGTQGVQQILGSQSEALQTRTKEEIQKLFRWEYKVIDLAGDLAPPALESSLGELGADGWECFQITTIPSAVRVMCKRRPPSALAYLKYIPGL